MSLPVAFPDTPGRRAASRPKATRRAPTAGDDGFIPLAETRALLAASAPARQQRLAAGDMLSTDEAAALAGTSRVTINAWIRQGRAIGLSQLKRGFRLPRWQFDPATWDVLPRLSQALGTAEGWALLGFLETPLGGLGGATPRQAIEQGGAERVVALAAGER